MDDRPLTFLPLPPAIERKLVATEDVNFVPAQNAFYGYRRDTDRQNAWFVRVPADPSLPPREMPVPGKILEDDRTAFAGNFALLTRVPSRSAVVTELLRLSLNLDETLTRVIYLPFRADYGVRVRTVTPRLAVIGFRGRWLFFEPDTSRVVGHFNITFLMSDGMFGGESIEVLLRIAEGTPTRATQGMILSAYSRHQGVGLYHMAWPEEIKTLLATREFTSEASFDVATELRVTVTPLEHPSISGLFFGDPIHPHAHSLHVAWVAAHESRGIALMSLAADCKAMKTVFEFPRGAAFELARFDELMTARDADELSVASLIKPEETERQWPPLRDPRHVRIGASFIRKVDEVCWLPPGILLVWVKEDELVVDEDDTMDMSSPIVSDDSNGLLARPQPIRRSFATGIPVDKSGRGKRAVVAIHTRPVPWSGALHPRTPVAFRTLVRAVLLLHARACAMNDEGIPGLEINDTGHAKTNNDTMSDFARALFGEVPREVIVYDLLPALWSAFQQDVLPRGV